MRLQQRVHGDPWHRSGHRSANDCWWSARLGCCNQRILEVHCAWQQRCRSSSNAPNASRSRGSAGHRRRRCCKYLVERSRSTSGIPEPVGVQQALCEQHDA
uniref:Uncharacterized protein n=1 Tax=uncultured marine virus TaxID=186617 RepID=A0A0F7L316_9VIRU|nr:hypothetical protein [uncultured marine virus]